MPELVPDGFVVLPGVLAAEQRAALRRRVDRLHRSPAPELACQRPGNTLIPLRWADPIVATVLLRSGVRDAIVARTGAADLRWISGYVTSKRPGSPPLAWHQDWWCWDDPASFDRRPAQVALLTYLTPTEPRSGALRVLPGSHHRGVPLHAELPEVPDAELPAGHPAVSGAPGQVVPALSPGDAALIDYRLLHGTSANATGYRRDGLILNFTLDWAGLAPHLRAHLIGHLALPHDGERPPGPLARFLPSYHGRRRDLRLNRVPPPGFTIAR